MDKRNREYAKRFWDELGFRKPGDPPTNLPALLDDLGVDGKSVAAKRQAVREWLKENEPLLSLLDELEDEGYIDS